MATASEAIRAPRDRSSAWHPSAVGWAARVAVLGLIFGGIIFVTATVQGFWANRIAYAAIFAIIGLSVNVVLGYVGQVSLGHHAFVGIAAFVAGYYVTERAGCVTSCPISGFVTATVLAAAVSAVAAGLLGLIALRIRGLYLALITLAYGFMAERSIFLIPFLTRGGAGMPAPRPEGFTTDTRFAFLTLAFLALVLFIDWSLLRSKVGRAILSVKHSEPVAASYGINITAYKVLAFIMSGVFAGVGGALFAFRNTQVVDANFNFTFALLWVLMVVVGGLGNRTGVVIGSAFFALFEFLVELIGPLEHFLETSGRPVTNYVFALGALLAIATIVKFPGGIAEQISPITRWLRGQPFTLHPEGHARPPRDRARQRGRLLERVGLRTPAADARGPAHAGPYIAETGLRPGFLGRLGLGATAAPMPGGGEPTTELPVAGTAAPVADDDERWRPPPSRRATQARPTEPALTAPQGSVESVPTDGDAGAREPAPDRGAPDRGAPDDGGPAEPAGSSSLQPGFLARLGLGSSRPKRDDR